jgi:hypothetical protein
MQRTTLRNFHVPLPDDLCKQLHAEAKRFQQPATDWPVMPLRGGYSSARKPLSTRPSVLMRRTMLGLPLTWTRHSRPPR